MKDSSFVNADFMYVFNIESIFGDSDLGDPIYIQVENRKVSS